jgi:hypothetical protein
MFGDPSCAAALRDRLGLSRRGGAGAGARRARRRSALCAGVRRHAHAAGLGRPRDHPPAVARRRVAAGGHLLRLSPTIRGVRYAPEGRASDGLLILKKPFEDHRGGAAGQHADAQVGLHREVQRRMDDLEATVQARTAELERSNEALRQTMHERQRIEVELRWRRSWRPWAGWRRASPTRSTRRCSSSATASSSCATRSASCWGCASASRKLVPLLAARPELQPLAAELLEAEALADSTT